MTLSTQSGFEQKLSKQLYRLSELSETLTLRLLDIEEKLLSLEQLQSRPLKDSRESTHSLLSESEERLKELQKLMEPSHDNFDLLESQPHAEVHNQTDMNEGNEVNSAYKNTFNSISLDSNNMDLTEFASKKSLENDIPVDVELASEYIDDSEMPLLSA